MSTAKKTEYVVTKKTKLGEATYAYYGKLTGGTEYVTGGEELIEGSESRYKLPTLIDFMYIAPENGWIWQFVDGSTRKIKIWGGASAAKGISVEAASEVTTVKDLTANFFAVGS